MSFNCPDRGQCFHQLQRQSTIKNACSVPELKTVNWNELKTAYNQDTTSNLGFTFPFVPDEPQNITE